jgi:hypothetical protein
VGKFTVFNIGGDKYRLIAAIHFNRGILYVHQVLTHPEYDEGKWKKSDPWHAAVTPLRIEPRAGTAMTGISN